MSHVTPLGFAAWQVGFEANAQPLAIEVTIAVARGASIAV
jgi:hypothetical protein